MRKCYAVVTSQNLSIYYVFMMNFLKVLVSRTVTVTLVIYLTLSTNRRICRFEEVALDENLILGNSN